FIINYACGAVLFDPRIMFKILIINMFNNIRKVDKDLINNYLFFMYFLALGLQDCVAAKQLDCSVSV
ncbi:MAG: hypothetical protein ABF576_13550, partial [Gluconobacter japonicus]